MSCSAGMALRLANQHPPVDVSTLPQELPCTPMCSAPPKAAKNHRFPCFLPGFAMVRAP